MKLPGKKKNFKVRNPNCQLFKKSVSALRRTPLGDNNISSATVERKGCVPGVDEVAIYQHSNFRGKCRILRKGSYKNSKAMKFKNDSISSIEFSQSSGQRNTKVKALVCYNANFKGYCKTLYSTASRLKDHSMNDAITSMKVILK